MLSRFCKPWFLYRPSTVLRRAAIALRPPAPGFQPLATAWGLSVLSDPSKDMGRGIHTTGVYDLAVSEALVRLANPGETVLDVGANIGYMTLLAAVTVGPAGRVISFEPHPELFSVLERNVSHLRSRGPTATIELHNTALGDHTGTAELLLPENFGANDGIARIVADGSGGRTIKVALITLDDILKDTTVQVMKLDVEGFELQVLQGARQTLEQNKIHHIIFEDHHVVGSEVVRFLKDCGYRIYSLGWTLRGPVIQPVERGILSRPFEPPNFIATLHPEVLESRCEPRGWRVLHRLVP